MIFRKVYFRVLLRVFSLAASFLLICLLIIEGKGAYSILVIPIIIYLVYNLYSSQITIYKELRLFVESLQNKDFSSRLPLKSASIELTLIHTHFNEISATIKDLSKEKETQYQYLQKVLEMIETGILSYQENTGKVIWMNEYLKNMIQLPYLKNLDSLAMRNIKLYNEIIQLRPCKSKICEIKSETGQLKILLSATVFQTDGLRYKLIVFQNVNEALNETETDAWQKLLGVLTHEIMNSIAPISSLADTLKDRIQNLHKENLEDSIEDLEIGVETIKRRSTGLLKFAETYRNLNKVSKPNLKEVFLKDLFQSLQLLMGLTLQQKGIRLTIILKDLSLSILADVNLLEQVLINLIVNAIEAVKAKENPTILLTAFLSKNKRINIQVRDNGSGIPEELLDKIFVPFFSTKKNGSGIGLTLCRQIMRLHQGNIQVASKNEGSIFTLEF